MAQHPEEGEPIRSLQTLHFATLEFAATHEVDTVGLASRGVCFVLFAPCGPSEERR